MGNTVGRGLGQREAGSHLIAEFCRPLNATAWQISPPSPRPRRCTAIARSGHPYPFYSEGAHHCLALLQIEWVAEWSLRRALPTVCPRSPPVRRIFNHAGECTSNNDYPISISTPLCGGAAHFSLPHPRGHYHLCRLLILGALR